ncbi:hypothetical protein [Acuticoccus yangtzensis]|uniref:hypothetical protein n=1 Tax=Acuticoccus yangtzensis TaxID=1443441 RepID=UPI0011152A5B|nr:hypothetical protein [Acuticoccus yangtzensis]
MGRDGAVANRLDRKSVGFGGRVAKLPGVRWRVRGLWLGVGVMAAALSGCTVDPAAPLIPLSPRPATMLPADAPPQTADGFPNILSDPANVSGLPRDPDDVAATKQAVAAEGAYSKARTGAINKQSFAGELSARGRSQVEEARQRIAASGRGAGPAPAAADPEEVRNRIASGSSRTPPAADAAPDAGRPVDPAEPQPRAVGPQPFADETVAPAQ